MSANHLPPHLARSLESLRESSATPHHRAILKELDTVSKILGMAATAGIPGAAVEELKVMRSGITTAGGNVCKCCQRPF